MQSFGNLIQSPTNSSSVLLLGDRRACAIATTVAVSIFQLTRMPPMLPQFGYRPDFLRLVGRSSARGLPRLGWGRVLLYCGERSAGQAGLSLARAVVPPPRLRAKSVSISAHLQPTSRSARWASPERAGAEKTLQIPARTPSFQRALERYSEGLFSGDPRETSNLSM